MNLIQCRVICEYYQLTKTVLGFPSLFIYFLHVDMLKTVLLDGKLIKYIFIIGPQYI